MGIFQKIAAGKAINIGYFGGSITEGSGASDPEKTSWRALVQAWFETAYPEISFSQISAAIGGTGSDLGIYRCRNDLLRFAPDLVFVEFAANDYNKAPEIVMQCGEGIVRQIYRHDPDCEIVFILTLTEPMYRAIQAGNLPESLRIYREIAGHYGIPVVDAGACFAETVDQGCCTWDALTIDSVHPNDFGYQMYADRIIAFLSGWAKKETKPQAADALPLFEKHYTGAGMIDAWTLTDSAFEKRDETMCGKYPHMITADGSGQVFRFEFAGTEVGLYHMIAHDSGDFLWSIDGEQPQRATTWDKYALEFDRANYTILARGLENKKHTLTVQSISDKNERSDGTMLRIAALLTGTCQ